MSRQPNSVDLDLIQRHTCFVLTTFSSLAALLGTEGLSPPELSVTVETLDRWRGCPFFSLISRTEVNWEDAAVTEGRERRPRVPPTSPVPVDTDPSADERIGSEDPDVGDWLRVVTCSRGCSMGEFHSSSSCMGGESMLVVYIFYIAVPELQNNGKRKMTEAIQCKARRKHMRGATRDINEWSNEWIPGRSG